MILYLVFIFNRLQLLIHCICLCTNVQILIFIKHSGMSWFLYPLSTYPSSSDFKDLLQSNTTKTFTLGVPLFVVVSIEIPKPLNLGVPHFENANIEIVKVLSLGVPHIENVSLVTLTSAVLHCENIAIETQNHNSIKLHLHLQNYSLKNKIEIVHTFNVDYPDMVKVQKDCALDQCQHSATLASQEIEKCVSNHNNVCNGISQRKVSPLLEDLTFTKQGLGRVSSVWHKWMSNVIFFASLIPKVDNILPSLIEELDEVTTFIYTKQHILGGGVSETFSYEDIKQYIVHNHKNSQKENQNNSYKFSTYCIKSDKSSSLNNDLIACEIPMNVLLHKLTISSLKIIASIHGIYVKTRTAQHDIIKTINQHQCQSCPSCITILQHVPSKLMRRKDININASKRYRQNKLNQRENQREPTSNWDFPPESLTLKLQHKVLHDWCKDMTVSHFEEIGCAICGELTLFQILGH